MSIPRQRRYPHKPLPKDDPNKVLFDALEWLRLHDDVNARHRQLGEALDARLSKITDPTYRSYIGHGAVGKAYGGLAHLVSTPVDPRPVNE